MSLSHSPLWKAVLLGLLLLGNLSQAGAAQQTSDLPEHWQRSYLDLDGKTQPLSQWRGKILAVNFWATWCPPCLHEIPDLVQFQKANAERIQIVGIGMDEVEKLRNVARTLNIDYPVLVTDPRDNIRLLANWGNRRGTVPYTVFFDQAGLIRILHRGPLDTKTLESYTAELEDAVQASTAKSPK